ncbi:MAG: dockerin type I repeat-containing protein [Bacteroidaceae bacterium]|nr:dockerin type I repeat-containing protein [Bacteroidaceae bacterium]
MKAKILFYTLFIMAFITEARATDANWDFDPYAYQYDMTVYMCMSSINGKSVNDCSDYQVAAFCGEECRGIAVHKTVGEQEYLYLRIRSNKTSGETISLKAIDIKSGRVAVSEETIDFKSQQTIGFPSSPMVVNFGNMLGDANGDGRVDQGDIDAVVAYMKEEEQAPFYLDAADVNEDGLVNVTDIVGIVGIMTDGAGEPGPGASVLTTGFPDYVLKAAPLMVGASGGDVSVPLDLVNKAEDVTAFECKVYLPECLEWKPADGKSGILPSQPEFSASGRRTDVASHTIVDVKRMTDDGYYVIVYSDTKEYFSGNGGAVLDLPLRLADGAGTGVYDLRVDGMVIAHTDGTDVKPEAYTTSVIVGQPTVITLKGVIDEYAMDVYKPAWEDNEGLTGLDVSGASHIADGTRFGCLNPNAVIMVRDGMAVSNQDNVVVMSDDGNTCACLALTDGHPFAAPVDFTAASATYSRVMAADYGTICLPYAPETELYDFYELADATEDKLHFTKVDAPKACTPYLYARKEVDGIISGTDVSVKSGDAGTTEADGWQMKGTFRKQTLTDNVYFLSDGALSRNTGTLTVNPFRGYFVGSSPDVKSAGIFIDGSPTGIMLSGNGEVADKDAPRYNLAGQQVGEDYKGVVIVNGRKVIHD